MRKPTVKRVSYVLSNITWQAYATVAVFGVLIPLQPVWAIVAAVALVCGVFWGLSVDA